MPKIDDVIFTTGMVAGVKSEVGKEPVPGRASQQPVAVVIVEYRPIGSPNTEITVA